MSAERRGDATDRRLGDETTGGVPRQREGGGRAHPDTGGAARPGTGDEVSDLALVQRMRDGDSAAYETLYRRHAEAVLRYARTCCRDDHTAEDLTGEVFARTLQAVRAGAGPRTAVRAYLLTSVRRVAATWVRTAKRERLVEDFAVFVESAAGSAAGGTAADELAEPPDVQAMRAADRTLAVEAFRSLPERYRTVLWHTAVERESPQEVAPLLGLSDNATAVLAHRAREKLKQAFLQAHVQRAATTGEECARYAPRLGAYVRGGLRARAERGLRKHLEWCGSCRAAALEVQDLNSRIRVLVPVAFVGWFGAAGGSKVLGLVAGTTTAGAASGAAASGTVAAGGAGAAGGGAASEGLGAGVKIGVAAGVTAAAGVAVAFALTGSGDPAPEPQAKPSVAPTAWAPPPPSPEPRPEQPAPEPTYPPHDSTAPSVSPSAAPTPSEPAPAPTKRPSDPTPPRPSPPEPTPTPSASPELFRLDRLPWATAPPGPGREGPTLRAGASSWLWQRYGGLRLGGRNQPHGVTVGSDSTVTVDLNRTCTAYEALVGVDPLSVGDRAVRFEVSGDGVPLWTSPALREADRPVRVNVPLTGVTTVRLTVAPVEPDRGPGHAATFADWAVATFRCR